MEDRMEDGAVIEVRAARAIEAREEVLIPYEQGKAEICARASCSNV